jgi:hypothetical protein
MAAENIDGTINGTGLFPAKIPGLSDAADIQAALRLYHYGSYTYDGANTNEATLLANPSVAAHLQTLKNADAAEVTNRNAAIAVETTNRNTAITTHNAATTNVHGIANTANLATQQFVATAVTTAISGATGGYPALAGDAIDWNSVDARFDVVPQLANVGTVITKTENFILSPDDVGKTAILYSSNPIVVTLPANALVEIPVGYSIDIIQTGTGSVTVSEGSDAVSINSKAGIKSLDGQYSKGTLVKIDTNTWFFFGNLLNVVVPTPVPTPVAPVPVPTPAVVPVAPTPIVSPVAPVVQPTAPTPIVSPVVQPTTPVAQTPTLATPSLSVSMGPDGFNGAVYANVTVTNHSNDNTYTSNLGTQNPEFPEEFNISGLTSGQSYTVYITASRSGYTSAQGSITFTANAVAPTPVATPTSPVAPVPAVAPVTPTAQPNYYVFTYYDGKCNYIVYDFLDNEIGTYSTNLCTNSGTDASGATLPSCSNSGCVSTTPVAPVPAPTPAPTPTVIVAPGTVYLSYCDPQGGPQVESYAINADNILSTNINTACATYYDVLSYAGATNIQCSTASSPGAPSCGTAPAPTPVAAPVAPVAPVPVPVAPTPVPAVQTSTIYHAVCFSDGGTSNDSSTVPNMLYSDCTTYRAFVLSIDPGASINCSASGPVSLPGCVAPTPAPTPVVPVAPVPAPVAPVAPVPAPTALTCPNNDTYGVTSGGVYSGSCPDGSCPGCSNYQEKWYKCSDGSSGTKFYVGLGCSTPVAPAPVAPAPVAPSPAPTAALDCTACTGYSGLAGTEVQDCSDGCGTRTLCRTPLGCANYYLNECPGCAAPTPVAPTPAAATPTASSPTACVANCVFDGYTCNGWAATYTYINYGCGGASACPPYTDNFGCA